MALTSTLGSPGIEIREVDNSIRLDSSTATTIYIPGFASQGPVDEVMSIGTISDFETIYGVPTNAAERYFYYTVKAILDNSGNGATVLCSRLPYGTGKGDTVSNAYTMLAYPAVPVIKKNYYKNYSCLTKNFEETHYIATFRIDGKNISFKCPIADVDTQSKWVLNGETELTYKFSILDDNLGYSVESSSGKVATINNSFETYDFDQYILDEESITTICNAFAANSKTPTLENYYISVDDDKIKSTNLNFTKIGTATIPSVGALISTESGGFNSDSFKAPTLTLDDDSTKQYTADGLIASEKIDNKYFVHISYTISTTGTDPKPCGSIYIKLSYDSDVSSKTTTGATTCDATATFVESFEIAKSYDGQDSKQSTND